MRRGEVALVLAILAGLVVAAILGERAAPSGDLFDLRRSTLLSGPNGAKGLTDALEALGVRVERRRRAWFRLGADTSSLDRSTLLVFLDIARALPLTEVELSTLRDFVAGGGSVFLAGRNDLESCLGVDIVDLLLEGGPDSLVVGEDAEDRQVRPSRAVLDWRAAGDPDRREELPCVPLVPPRVDTLLSGVDGRSVAWRMHFGGGGRAIVLADSRYVSNRDLRETDAGVVVLPWVIEPPPSVVLVDEYHQGFGRRGSIFAAAWRWARSSPLGWAMLQLAVAGLAGLAVASVRFGPAIKLGERRRRSPVEHLDALAVGLERAEAGGTAIQLMVSGLRRRLRSRAVVSRRRRDDSGQWLATLALGARGANAGRAVDRLRGILMERESEERVRRAALAVEDVWEALTHENRPSRS